MEQARSLLIPARVIRLPNVAAQWRAVPDATNTNSHASARPLKQPGWA